MWDNFDEWWRTNISEILIAFAAIMIFLVAPNV